VKEYLKIALVALAVVYATNKVDFIKKIVS